MKNVIAVKALRGSKKDPIVHAAGELAPRCQAAWYALCGDNRGIGRLSAGYLQTSLPVNCPSCLQRVTVSLAA